MGAFYIYVYTRILELKKKNKNHSISGLEFETFRSLMKKVILIVSTIISTASLYCQHFIIVKYVLKEIIKYWYQ